MRHLLGDDAASKRAAARLGCLIIGVSKLLALPTILTTPSRVTLPAVLLMHLADIPLALAAQALPWERLSRRWLLAWPAWTAASLAVAGAFVFEQGAATIVGFIAVGFVFIGLTQPPWTSVATLPFAAAAWIAAYGAWSPELLLRAPIAFGVWILLAETLAFLRHEAQTAAATLERDASTDPLTGLWNRRELAGLVEPLIDDDAVALLDVDHFKALNDELGHAAGDKVLSDLADAIRDVLRPDDAAVRIGGDEILLIMPAAGVGGAEDVIGRLQQRWIATQPGVTLSAGIAVVRHATAGMDAVRDADAALYEAKRAGRNRSCVAPCLVPVAC